jgi:hypothetical protein
VFVRWWWGSLSFFHTQTPPKHTTHPKKQTKDLRGNIRVFCRIRPAGVTGDASAPCVDVYGEGGELALYDPARPRLERKAFSFDRVFDAAAGQEEVYADTQPLIRSVLDGAFFCGVGVGFFFVGGLFCVRVRRRCALPINTKLTARQPTCTKHKP